MQRLNYATAITLVAVAAAGCGGGGSASAPKLAKVKGTVTYKGKAIAGALVGFHAENAPRAAQGTTDSEGRFELTMFNTGDGALVGDNVVTVSKDVAIGNTSTTPESAMNMYKKYEDMKKAGQKVGEAEVPEKYRDKTSSPQKNHVEAGKTNEFNIELTD
jgi:hypothetical protein